MATGLIGILNNKQWIYERGMRTLTLDGQATEISAEGGKVVDAAARQLMIDQRLTITSESPLPIHYAAAEQAERGRATDLLYLNHLPTAKAWKAGETISRYRATIQVR